jgi:hypothetical protein
MYVYLLLVRIELVMWKWTSAQSNNKMMESVELRFPRPVAGLIFSHLNTNRPNETRPWPIT